MQRVFQEFTVSVILTLFRVLARAISQANVNVWEKHTVSISRAEVTKIQIKVSFATNGQSAGLSWCRALLGLMARF